MVEHMTNSNAKNEYKIDWNIYYSECNPYALFGRRPGWWPWRKWEHIASFKTKDEVMQHYGYLTGLPIILGGNNG